MTKMTVSLRTRLLALLVAVFALIAGATLLQANDRRQQAIADATFQLERESRLLIATQAAFAGRADRLVSELAERVLALRARHAPNPCPDDLASYLDVTRGFVNLGFADASGQVVCSATTLSGAVDVSARPFFLQARALGRLITTDLVVAPVSGQATMIYARAVSDANDRFLGVAYAAADLNWLSGELSRYATLPGAAAFVLDRESHVVARHPDGASLPAAALPPVDGRAHHAEDGDRHHLMVVAEFAGTASGALRLLITMPRERALQAATAALQHDLAAAALILGVAALLAWLGTRELVLRPIAALQAVVARFTAGDLSARSGAVTTGGEIGDLARRFDVMAETLQKETLARSRAHAELERLNRSLHVLSGGNRALLNARDETDLIHVVCRLIIERGGYARTWIGFSSATVDQLILPRVAYAAGSQPASVVALNEWRPVPLEIAGVTQAIKQSTPVVVHRHMIEHAGLVTPQDDPVVCALVLPLLISGRTAGVLVICSTLNDEFDERERYYLGESAADLAFGIDVIRTRGELDRVSAAHRHHDQRLRKSLEDTLRAVSTTLEMRDPYTAGHQRRVARLALRLAEKLGLGPSEAHGIYLAGLVHDIGKIHIPAEILARPGRLSELEFALIKEHPQHGEAILRDIEFPWPLAEMVLQHHERLDGQGYPSGKRDGEILFGARILAVADVVEAMFSHRPYRPGLGLDNALAEIERGRGTSYDPVVVDACLSLFRDDGYDWAE